jgi:GNAT superfamily N-acetyltransferase
VPAAEWRDRDGWVVSCDPARLDPEVIWRFLRTSYWASGITLETVERSIEHSLPFGLYDPDGGQAGFARAVTDRTRFAWLADVFVLEQHRGQGRGVFLVQSVLAHPELAGLRWVLATADAHGLYERFGFTTADPERMMERRARAR